MDVLSATRACTLNFVHKSQNDFYFIDRNGRYFEPILDYLRSGDWICPTGFDEKKLLAVCLYNLLLNILSSTVLSLLLLLSHSIRLLLCCLDPFSDHRH